MSRAEEVGLNGSWCDRHRGPAPYVYFTGLVYTCEPCDQPEASS